MALKILEILLDIANIHTIVHFNVIFIALMMECSNWYSINHVARMTLKLLMLELFLLPCEHLKGIVVEININMLKSCRLLY